MDTHRIPAFFEDDGKDDFWMSCDLVQVGKAAAKTKVKDTESFQPQSKSSAKRNRDTWDGKKRLQKTLAGANKTLSTLKKLKQQTTRSSQQFNKLVVLCNDDTLLASNVWQKLGSAVYECSKDPNLKFSASIKRLKDSIRKKLKPHPLGKVQNKVFHTQQQPPSSFAQPTPDKPTEYHGALDGGHSNPPKEKVTKYLTGLRIWLARNEAKSRGQEALKKLEGGIMPDELLFDWCWKFIKRRSYYNPKKIVYDPDDSYNDATYKVAFHEAIMFQVKHFHDLLSKEERILEKFSRGYTFEKLLEEYGPTQKDLISRVYLENEVEVKKRMRRLLIGRFAQGCSVNQLVKEFGRQNSGLIYQVLIQDQQKIKEDLMEQLLCYLEADYTFAEILEIFGNSVVTLLQHVALNESYKVSLVKDEINKMKKRQEERARQKKVREKYTTYVNKPNEHFDMKLIDEVKQELGIKQLRIERMPVSDSEVENVLNVWFPDCGLI